MDRQRVFGLFRKIPAFFSRFGAELFVFTVTFVVYLKTLCPVIYVGDSGELTAAALSLGIAHPPGYPLYVILGKLFSIIIPGGPSAFEMNLFSAWWGSCSAVALYSVLKLLRLHRLTCACMALTLAFINPFWSQAVVARVYTLNSFLMLCALACLIHWYTAAKEKSLARYFVFLGFGLANHTIAIITLPLFLVLTFSFSAFKTIYQPKKIMRYALAALPGLSLYLFLPLRALTSPAINWGNPGKHMNLMSFILRSEYWDRKYVHNIEDTVDVAVHYLSLIPKEFLYIGTLFIVIGVYAVFRQSKRIGLAVVLLYALNIYFMILHASRPDIYYWPRYIIPAFISVTVLLAFGLECMAGWLRKASFIRYAGILFPLALVIVNFHQNDRSRTVIAHEINTKILNSLPQNATLVAQGDNILFPISYFYHVKKMRRDLSLFELGMNELLPLEFHPKKNLTFFTHYQEFGLKELMFVPHGLVYQIATPDMIIPEYTDWNELSLSNLETEPVYFDYLCRCLAADYYFMIAATRHRQSFDNALPFYRKAGEIAYDNDVTHYNLGLVYQREGYLREAIAEFRKVVAIDKKNDKARQYISMLSQQLDQLVRYHLKKGSYTDSEYMLVIYKNNMDRLFKTGDILKAKEYAHKIINLTPDSGETYSNLATLCLLEGDYLGALDAYKKTLDSHPNNKAAQTNIENITAFITELNSLKIPENKNSLSQEQSDELVDELSRRLAEKFNEGKIHEAVFYAYTITGMSPDSAKAHHNLAALYMQMKLYPAAYEHFRRALVYSPDDEELQSSCKKAYGFIQQNR
ncbi:MAG: DUF2723 domain-containing protein [Candidatus Auribacterota bacterium]